MWMHPNGVVTREECPNCGSPFCKVRHGHDDRTDRRWPVDSDGGGRDGAGSHGSWVAKKPR